MSRECDLKMLEAVADVFGDGTDDARIRDFAAEAGPVDPAYLAKAAQAFDSMRVDLGATAGKLSARQRKWLTDFCATYCIDWETPAERNAHIPRGRDVELPAVLRHLPKSPPGRRGVA